MWCIFFNILVMVSDYYFIQKSKTSCWGMVTDSNCTSNKPLKSIDEEQWIILEIFLLQLLVVNDLQTLSHPPINFEPFTLPTHMGRIIDTLPCQNFIYLPVSIVMMYSVLWRHCQWSYILWPRARRWLECVCVGVSNCGCNISFF